MDVVKTCMQGDLARAVHRDPLSTCRNLIAEGGIGALMRGAGWRTLNITLTVFIAGEVCQRLPPYLLRRWLKRVERDSMSSSFFLVRSSFSISVKCSFTSSRL